MQSPDSNPAFMKGPKRKRLAKACDACHKSKRRCDGTAPCSNCYYASKHCSYTDASGRPVPAPRPFKPERQESSSTASESRSYASSHAISSTAHQFRIYPQPTTSHQVQNDYNDDDHKLPRKRFRNDRGNPMPIDDLIIDGPIASASIDRPPSVELDASLTRELTNLFFAHCHPARAVIHKPTFSSSLSHNRVPSHLLLAVCALAAPLSKQPHIRTSPARFAGKRFAQDALSQMFDGAGRLIVEPDVAAAQALCILQLHDILTTDGNTMWSSRFHELALQIVERLGVHEIDHPTLTPVPSPEFVQSATEREAIRRIFWLIHVLDVMASIYFKKPVTFSDAELRLRLPVDETSFELGVHSTLSEYLYLSAVRTQWASEFGHLIRILSIYAKLECAIDELNDADALADSGNAFMDLETKMNEWDRTLPEQLRFSEQSLQVQQSMFETSSNAGAWCWCCLHVYHASCALAFKFARNRTQRAPRSDPTWAIEKIEMILKMLGDRAKNSILMGAALWALIKYCERDDPPVRKWATDYEEAFGTKIYELVHDWRSQPSPPQQHQHLTYSHSQSQQSQQAHGSYHQHPNSHRRLSDGRNTIPHNFNLNVANANSRSLIREHDSEPYSNASSNNNQIMKRSQSRSPPSSYAVGCPTHLKGDNNSIPNRTANHGLTSNSDTFASHNTFGRDTNTALAPGDEHGPSQNMPKVKYNSREGNPSRWPPNVGDTITAGYMPTTGPGVAGDINSEGAHVSGVGGIILSGNGSAPSGNLPQRNFAPSGEGNQSLPSLKASGLLDSWGTVEGELQKQIPNGVKQQHSLAGKPSTELHRESSATIQSNTTDLRPTTLAMPVGLQWLAHESR